MPSSPEGTAESLIEVGTNIEIDAILKIIVTYSKYTLTCTDCSFKEQVASKIYLLVAFLKY